MRALLVILLLTGCNNAIPDDEDRLNKIDSILHASTDTTNDTNNISGSVAFIDSTHND